MCGLIAAVSKTKGGLSMFDVDIFDEMLLVGQLRGTDGTGLFYGDRKGQVKTLKSVYQASTVRLETQYQDAISDAFKTGQYIVGHNRAATKGKSELEFTHPFIEKHITLVHNGTLSTHKELHETLISDSHSICYSMATVGEEETIKKINGAFALIWINNETKKLNICRNSQRPLFLIETYNSYFICSEELMGKWIIERNNCKVIKSEQIKIEKLYSWDLEDTKDYTITPLVYKSIFSGYKDSNYDYGEYYKKGGDSVYTDGFSFGEKVKFKAGFTRKVKEPNSDTYLEGDLEKNQKKVYKRGERKYEEQWRIKIYGNPEELKLLQNKKNLIGSVASTLVRGHRVTYILTNVKEEEPEEVVVEGEEKTCSWCGNTTKKPLINMYTSEICDDCYKTNEVWST